MSKNYWSARPAKTSTFMKNYKSLWVNMSNA